MILSENASIFVGNFAHSIDLNNVAITENAFLIVQNGKIVAIGKKCDLNATVNTFRVNEIINKITVQELTPSQLLIPGFIDTHIHAAQYPNCGLGYDKPLLKWLEHYTYPLEKDLKDPVLAKKIFDAVVKRTLSHGTTTAVYFGSLYKDITLILADSAIKFGQRAFVGKINMTCFSPCDYVETEEETIKNTEEFIREMRAKKCKLVKPIITPRFAISCSENVLKQLGHLAKMENLHIQSHISENVSEIAEVEARFGKSYTEVYEDAQLLTKKTILAHGVHLKNEEIKLLDGRGTTIAHCPESNSYLKSGVCKVSNLLNKGVNVSLGTDISGGASPSILSAMRGAINSSNILSFVDSKSDSITWENAFYMATLGGAKALDLSSRIGSFAVGKDFDAIVVDMNVIDSNADYLIPVSPKEILQKFIYIGDDRNIQSVYVSGNKVK